MLNKKIISLLNDIIRYTVHITIFNIILNIFKSEKILLTKDNVYFLTATLLSVIFYHLTFKKYFDRNIKILGKLKN